MKKFALKDIILLGLIAIVFGVIYFAAGFLYDGITLALTPFKLGPMANDLLLGLWCMAGPLAACLLQKPGTSFLTELIGSCIELVLGGQWGAANIISGVVQGLGSELGFACLGYKHYGWGALTLSAVTTTIVTYAYDLVRNGYAHFGVQLIILYFVVRLVMMLLFSCVLVKLILNLVAESGVVKHA